MTNKISDSNFYCIEAPYSFKLFIQEMLKRKIMMPWISISYRHNQKTLNKTLVAIEQTLKIYKKALKYGPKKYIDGHIIKPVFRRFN